MKNKLAKAIIFALLGVTVWIVLVKGTSFVKQSNALQPANNTSQLLMEWREVITDGVSTDEKDRIVEFVDTFERAIAQHDTEKVLSFFSEPETGEEQKELDFILGSDIARNSANSSAQRLFTTQGYNFSLGAHYVRNVSAQDTIRRVMVDEIRIIRSGGEWVGTVANVSHLVVELRETSHGYEIVRYYHEDSDNKSVLKYDGFVAK